MNLYQTMMDSTIAMVLAQQGVEILVGSTPTNVLIQETATTSLGNSLDLVIVSTNEVPKGTVFTYNSKEYLMIASSTNEKFTSYYSGVCRELKRKDDFFKLVDGDIVQPLIDKFGITANRTNVGVNDTFKILEYDNSFTIDTKFVDKKIFATTLLKRGDFIIFNNDTYIVNSTVAYKDNLYSECFIRQCIVESQCHRRNTVVVNQKPTVVDLGYLTVKGYVSTSQVSEYGDRVLSLEQNQLSFVTQLSQEVLDLLNISSAVFEDFKFTKSGLHYYSNYKLMGLDRSVEGIITIYMELVVG